MAARGVLPSQTHATQTLNPKAVNQVQTHPAGVALWAPRHRPRGRTRMQKTEGVRLIEMTELQWELFFTCWKYNLEFYRGRTFRRYLYSLGVPFYYAMLGRRLFGEGIKYPLWRFAGVPDSLLRRRLHLDFSGVRRNPAGLRAPTAEIAPAYRTVQGLNMVEAKSV